MFGSALALLHIEAYIHFKERKKNFIASNNIPPQHRARKSGSISAKPQMHLPHKMSLSSKQSQSPMAPGGSYNEINKQWISSFNGFFLSGCIYESSFHSITNDSKLLELWLSIFHKFYMINCLPWVILLISRSKFSKGRKVFCRWGLQDTHFSFSFNHLNFRCQKSKLYDLTGDRFLPLGRFMWKKVSKIVMKCPMPTSWSHRKQNRHEPKDLTGGVFHPMHLTVPDSGISS